jgi:hypothetical protein
MHGTLRRRRFVWLLMVGLLPIMTSFAQKEAPSEYEVKSAFLYNFAKFTTWPTNAFSAPDAPLLIAVLGENPFGERLDETVRGRGVEGRKIVIQRFANPREYPGGAHIVFVSNSERRNLAEILRTLRGSHSLTVGESEGFVDIGGVLEFRMDNNRVRFDVNTQAAEAQGLKLSSKLLSVAAKVTGPKPR